jgi:cytochrome b subunit of formate dehydrogenase
MATHSSFPSSGVFQEQGADRHSYNSNGARLAEEQLKEAFNLFVLSLKVMLISGVVMIVIALTEDNPQGVAVLMGIGLLAFCGYAWVKAIQKIKQAIKMLRS